MINARNTTGGTAPADAHHVFRMDMSLDTKGEMHVDVGAHPALALGGEHLVIAALRNAANEMEALGLKQWHAQCAAGATPR